MRAEDATEKMLTTYEPREKDLSQEFKDKTVKIINEFIIFYEENQIIFDKTTIKKITSINDAFEKAKKAHILTLSFGMETEAFKEAATKKSELHLKLNDEIPALKENLKMEFQEKYSILTT